MKKFLLLSLVAVQGLYAMESSRIRPTQAKINQCLESLPFGLRKKVQGRINPNTIDQVGSELPKPHYDNLKACLGKQTQPLLGIVGTESRGMQTATGIAPSRASQPSAAASVGINSNSSSANMPNVRPSQPNVMPYRPGTSVAQQVPAQEAPVQPAMQPQNKQNLISPEEFVATYKDAPANQVLGLPANASPEQIRKNYRALVLQWHPDKNDTPGAGDAFQIIQRAYTNLSLANPS